MGRVLVVATSRKTRGGITSVVKAHEAGAQWSKYHCRWIQTHVDKGILWKFIYAIRGFVEYLTFLPGADIVHIHVSEPPSALRKLVFFRLAKWLGKKIVMHFHSFSSATTINGPYSLLYRKLFCGADVVVVLSNYWKEVVDEKFHLGDRIKVIYNPCPTITYAQKYEKTNSILYAGTLNQRKGYADLINAFAKVAPKHPDWKIALSGNGEVQKARVLARELGIENQVELLGWISGENKDKAYKQASVFCLPSYAEGFPMAVLDAWAYRLPVVTTPVGGISDVAIDGENMLLFNPSDIDTLAEKLDLIMNDGALREKLSASSAKMASEKFNLNTVTKQVANIYESLR
ncbi:MAG: glycosyltransferase family 4 protein [Bacteroidaceae bacterium]|nr:glycosyltransferase family 4 protein [Bacteroidaceae bacterium]